MKLSLTIIGKTRWLLLENSAKTPQKTQLNILLSIIDKNKKTAFGKSHDFSLIESASDFKRYVPIQTYEDLRDHFELQRQTQKPELTSEQPVMFAQTSGTTGDPKYLPITNTAITDFKRRQSIASYLFYKHCPQAFDGNVLAIVSPAIEGHFNSGMPYGAASGFIYESMPSCIREKYTLPASIFNIKNYDIKYRILLTLALAKSNISYIACANPSTLVHILKLAKDNLSTFIEYIDTGKIDLPGEIGELVKMDIEKTFQANPDRAACLRTLVTRKDINLSDLWPSLRLITTWTSGSCGVALSSISHGLSHNVNVIDIGYLSSEVCATVTCDIKSQSGLPTMRENFFEFIEIKKWEEGHRQTLLLHELTENKKYYIVVTTKIGLYRYFMHDIVRVTGFLNNTPLLKFEQKGKGITSITGEKLHESQLLSAISDVFQNSHLSPVFVMGLADVNARQYQIFIETQSLSESFPHNISAHLDQELCRRNIEYQSKRDSSRLQTLTVYRLTPGTYELYKKFCLQQGQREGQFKTIALQYKEKFPFDFSQHQEGKL